MKLVKAALIGGNMQNGSVRKHHGAWWYFFREKVIENGVVVNKKRAERLAPANACKDKWEAAKLAKPTMLLINSDRPPESTDSFSHFLESIYLPTVQKNQKPSTYNSYAKYFQLLKPHLSEKPMRDFRTPDVSRVMKALVAEKKRARTTARGCRNFMSGAFKYAKNEGHFSGENPVRDVILPKGTLKPRPTYAYSLPEIMAMLKVLPEPGRTAVMLAAFTGLRHGEIRGLRWEDFNGSELNVTRNVWGVHVGEVKTPESAAAVPVVGMLAKALEAHHKRNPQTEWIFTGERYGRPANLVFWVSDYIMPALKAAGLEWHGWHAFRRGLGSNLNSLGVDDSVIQKILRHSDVSLTQRFYIKTTGKESQDALKKVEDAYERC